MDTVYGAKGSIKVGGQVLAHMSEWSIDNSADIQDASFFGGKGKEKTVGTRDWSGSYNGRIDFATTSGQKTLWDKFQAGEEIEMIFYLNDTTFFTGKAFIESLNFSNTAEGEYNIEISVNGNGELKLTVPEEA